MTHLLSNYSIENHSLLNMPTTKAIGYSVDNNKLFKIEKELSVEEKIKFIDDYAHIIDSRYQKFASSMIELIKKWNAEKGSLPQDQYDKPKTVSKKAWFKRNDTLKLVDIDYKIGTYYFASNYHKNLDLICGETDYGYNMMFTGSHIVDQWFHDLLKKLYWKESEHFKSVDSYHVKFEKLKELSSANGSFDIDLLNTFVWNPSKLDKSILTEEMIDALIESFDEINAFQEKVKKKLLKKFPNLQ